MTEVPPRALRDLTTLRVGAAPSRMIDATTRDELIDALREVWRHDESWFVLGGGSNLLASDEPFDGTVIRILTSGFTTVPSGGGGIRVRVEAGQNWDEFVAWAVSQGLAGVEAMSGIPGTAGAAPIQNVGAYGQEIVETLVEVDLIDRESGDVHTVPAAELQLGPRTSVLKRHYGREPERDAVILALTLELRAFGIDERPVRDARLRAALGLDAAATMSLRQIRDRVLSIRAAKGMVLDEHDHDTWSAGSFFQNPILSEQFARTLPSDCPRFPLAPEFDPMTVIPLATFDGVVTPPPVSPREVKVPAAWLIEHAGLTKGFKLPHSRAALSTKHALAITNLGGATAAEIGQLARFIRSRVSAEFGIELQPEPVVFDIEI